MSVVTTLENAIVAALSAQAGSFPSGTTFIARRTPSLPSSTNPPAVVVSVGEEGPVEPYTGLSKLKKFPVAVTVFVNGGHKMYDDPNMRAARDLIEQLLDDDERTTLWTVVPGFNRCTAGGKPPYNTSALKADIVCSSQVFTCEIIINRV